MGLISEFKAFAMRGNVVDMAVGVILGGAFGTVVSSLVEKVMMPPLGWAMGRVDFSQLSIKLSVPGIDGNPIGDPVEIGYGAFINAVIKFVIVAFALFMLIKAMNRLKRKEEVKEAVAPVPTKEEILLTEIRDLLAVRR
ncbi:MAG: large-conductance mechanosensitive channel protein MscL [Planctomycetota bacterium]|nr:large-conductance mechanosensitive channel protein MscL [Planctomycetota bacterium]